MVLATFNLPQEIRERLKLEENQSQLVTTLLINNFQDIKADDIEKQISMLKTQKDLQKQTIDIKIKELKAQIQVKKKEQEQIGKKKASSDFIKKAREEAQKEMDVKGDDPSKW